MKIVQKGTMLMEIRDLYDEQGNKTGETPEECARRELLEGTGLKAEKLELIGITRKPETRSAVYAFHCKGRLCKEFHTASGRRNR